MEKFFEVEDLRKQFGGLVAVDGVHFHINRNEVVGLIGPNGSGKSTILRLINGILHPTRGKVKFKGEDITGQAPNKITNKGIASTSQIVKPFRGLSVLANVLVPALSPRGKREGEWVKTAEVRGRDALEFCGIADLSLESASTLSHGDLKRLEIARAIATAPELLILDEPLGGLNPAEADLIIKSLKRLHKGGRFGRLHSEGPAILIVEHRLAELMKIAERLLVLNFGCLIADGPPEDVVKNKEVIKAYLGREVG